MMQSAPPPPPLPNPPGAASYAAAYRQPPMSVTAVIGFVCSLLGCLGITALLGFIFGIVGLFATRGGRKRGVGFAIAAIPISVITGLLCVVFGLFTFGFGSFAVRATKHIEALLKGELSTAQAASAVVLEMTTPGFQLQVPPEALVAWVAQTRAKHGKLVDLQADNDLLQQRSQDGKMSFNLKGKFVNGTVPVQLQVQIHGIWDFRVDDILVDGVSPRGAEPEGDKVGSPKPPAENHAPTLPSQPGTPKPPDEDS